MSHHNRINRTDAEWATLVTEFKTSGMTQVAFCDQRGINVYSFRRRYQRSEQFSGKRRQSSQAAFTEWKPPCPTLPVGLLVRVGEHVRIECPAQMEVASIVQLVRGLTDGT